MLPPLLRRGLCAREKLSELRLRRRSCRLAWKLAPRGACAGACLHDTFAARLLRTEVPSALAGAAQPRTREPRVDAAHRTRGLLLLLQLSHRREPVGAPARAGLPDLITAVSRCVFSGCSDAVVCSALHLTPGRCLFTNGPVYVQRGKQSSAESPARDSLSVQEALCCCDTRHTPVLACPATYHALRRRFADTAAADVAAQTWQTREAVVRV